MPPGVIVNSTANIGANCNLSPFTVIGSNQGQAATVGDCVYIGPHVSIVEDITIGDGSIIGAGASSFVMFPKLGSRG